MNVNRAMMLCVSALLVLGAAGPSQADWTVVYETGFPSDPGWTTNNSSLYYWDSSSQTYFGNSINVNYAGYYTYYDVAHDGSSFRLEWDMKVTDTDYASGLKFGLFDSDMRTEPDGSCIFFCFTLEDRGNTTFLMYRNSANEGHSAFGNLAQYSLNTWYHIRMEYNAEAETIIAEITDRETADPFNYLSLTNVGSFSADMGRIGSSNVRSGTFQVPGAEMLGYFDNVAFSVPEPATLALLAAGLGALVVRRRRT